MWPPDWQTVVAVPLGLVAAIVIARWLAEDEKRQPQGDGVSPRTQSTLKRSTRSSRKGATSRGKAMRNVRTFAMVVILLGVGACTDSAEGGWTDDRKFGLMEECMKDGTSKEECACDVAVIATTISYKQFLNGDFGDSVSLASRLC